MLAAMEDAHESAPVARWWLAPALWYVASGLAAWSFGHAVTRASDLWWHVATGRLILEQRAIPLADPFSFTREGQPWLQHEWLADLVYAAWVRAFGMPSLVYWKWGLLVATFALLLATLRRTAREPVAAYVGMFAAAAIAAPFLDVRPHLYSLLGYVLLLALTYERESTPLYLPALFLVWANLHAGFFFGLMALAVILAPHALRAAGTERRRTVIVGLGCALASAATPNGISAFTYPLRYALDRSSPFRELAEWQPPFASMGIESPLFPWAMGLFAVAAVFSLRSSGYRRERGIPVVGLMLAVLTLAMALTSRRFIPLFAISQSLVVAPALGYLLAPIARRMPEIAPPVAASLLSLALLVPYTLTSRAFGELTGEETYPRGTCDYIEEKALSGRVFAYYNWGGYLHLRTAGRLKVYIDGRADTVFDDETYRRYLVVLRMRPGWREVVETSGADYVLWPTAQGRQMLGELVTSGHWRVLLRDELSTLLERVETAAASP
jgi:hypothetical protein